MRDVATKQNAPLRARKLLHYLLVHKRVSPDTINSHSTNL